MHGQFQWAALQAPIQFAHLSSLLNRLETLFCGQHAVVLKETRSEHRHLQNFTSSPCN
ncbi:hypothetical protein IscW_ISCW008213 [Ixodes scapularis]|uniref:Uncharacterized protein n=1 Tax=Ixodes scapularis TaxID=6945 RepID=B7PWD8_IXOSC|nr:hypothetical protein IscW_ISCW008213 [Ixodes scapularis]|eukprot:XP_002409697.1 hypothetical protein IscW_ISCW008213 [Ixodes scapularis]